jgi:hypothetical protein
VVAPDAELKVWLTADEDERARRRGVPAAEVRERDERDASREHSPMVPRPMPSRSTPPAWASTTSWRGSWSSWGRGTS